MIELARHIEILLLENDCVIVPGFGGFVAYHTHASREEKEHLFLPPSRTIGFSPQLKMNDGLLVQSYMNRYATNFPDATHIVRKAVDRLYTQLHVEGKVELANIGEVRYTLRQTYEFTPFDNKLTSPGLYGLGAFEMKPLSVLAKPVIKPVPAAAPSAKARKKMKRIRRKRNIAYLRNAVALIALVASLFFISTPVENTYVENMNYAELMPLDLFENIESQSVLVTPVPSKDTQQKTPSEKNQATAKKTITVKEVVVPEKTPATTPAPVAVAKSEPVQATQPLKANQPEPSAVKSQEPKGKRSYHIIVAGGVTQKNAETFVGELKAKGYSNATILNNEGKIRVSLMAFGTDTEAYREVSKQRNGEFKEAWVLANK